MDDSSNNANPAFEVLADENASLREELSDQRATIEKQNQEIFSSKRRIERLEAMRIEMEIRLEALSGLNLIKENLESKVKALETEISGLKSDRKNIDELLEGERNAHNVRVEGLMDEISRLRTMQSECVPNTDEYDELLTKFNKLQDEVNEVCILNSELKAQNDEFFENAHQLEIKRKSVEEERDELKGILEGKSEDLRNARELIQELQNERAQLSSEISTLKAESANHEFRGNSLFAEVEDNRKAMEQKLTRLVAKFNKLKVEYTAKNRQITKLEVENTKLKKQWEEDKNKAPFEITASLIEGYKIRIAELEALKTHLEKRPESPQIISVGEGNDAEVHCIKAVLEYERQHNRELRKEMEQRSIRELSDAEALSRSKREVLDLKSQVMRYQALIEELQMQLKKADNVSPSIANAGPIIFNSTPISHPIYHHANVLADIQNTLFTESPSVVENRPKNASKCVRFDDSTIAVDTAMEVDANGENKESSDSTFVKPKIPKSRCTVVTSKVVRVSKENCIRPE